MLRSQDGALPGVGLGSLSAGGRWAWPWVQQGVLWVWQGVLWVEQGVLWVQQGVLWVEQGVLWEQQGVLCCSCRMCSICG